MLKNKDKKPVNIWKRIINIVFALLLIIIVMITVDYVRVTKYEYTPLFAIKTKELKDGGTKEYTGLGYKVIDYNQVNKYNKITKYLVFFT